VCRRRAACHRARPCHFGMRCTPAARASFMLAGRPDAFRANSTSSERRLTRVVSPRPVYGDALALFRNTGAAEPRVSHEPDSLASGLGVNSLQCPSETTSTVPSTTCMAV
jgi:hypothetical protein